MPTNRSARTRSMARCAIWLRAIATASHPTQMPTQALQLPYAPPATHRPPAPTTGRAAARHTAALAKRPAGAQVPTARLGTSAPPPATPPPANPTPNPVRPNWRADRSVRAAPGWPCQTGRQPRQTPARPSPAPPTGRYRCPSATSAGWRLAISPATPSPATA